MGAVAAEVDADAGAIVSGAGEGFEEAVEGVEGGGAEPPGEGKLVAGLDFGRGVNFEAGAEGEVVCGGVGGGESFGRGGGPYEGAGVLSEGVGDDGGGGGFVEGVMGDEVGVGGGEEEDES